MRLVDADALGLNDFEIIMCDGDYKEALKMLLGKIDAAPTIEERKTGKWLKAYGDHEAFGVRPFYRYCSECNESTVWQYRYCPNCGARMEE